MPCCCGPSRPRTLPRHERHAPLGHHLLLAKTFAGWHGFIVQIHREREEIAKINAKIKTAAVRWDAEAASSWTKDLDAKEKRRLSLQASRAAQVRGESATPERNNEVAYIQRLVTVKQEEHDRDKHAEDYHEARKEGRRGSTAQYYDDDEFGDDEIVLPEVTPQPLPPSSPEAPAEEPALQNAWSATSSFFSNLFRTPQQPAQDAGSTRSGSSSEESGGSTNTASESFGRRSIVGSMFGRRASSSSPGGRRDSTGSPSRESPSPGFARRTPAGRGSFVVADDDAAVPAASVERPGKNGRKPKRGTYDTNEAYLPGNEHLLKELEQEAVAKERLARATLMRKQEENPSMKKGRRGSYLGREEQNLREIEAPTTSEPSKLTAELDFGDHSFDASQDGSLEASPDGKAANGARASRKDSDFFTEAIGRGNFVSKREGPGRERVALPGTTNRERERTREGHRAPGTDAAPRTGSPSNGRQRDADGKIQCAQQ